MGDAAELLGPDDVTFMGWDSITVPLNEFNQ